MTWFKIDDSFHSHPKVLATQPAALGLWVVAGAWSSANLTDGFVPDHALPRLLPDAATLAKELVTAGLWTRTRGGYRFHDWAEYNPTKAEATAKQEAKQRAGRQGGIASGRARRAGKTSKQTRNENEAAASQADEARPDPTRSSPQPPANGGQPSRCQKHKRPKDYCADCRRPALAPVPDHCGQCDLNRWIINEQGYAVRKCPNCHPAYRGERHEPSDGYSRVYGYRIQESY